MPDAHPDWWDPYSDQPYKLADELKPRSGGANVREYAGVAGTALIHLPRLVTRYLQLRPYPQRRDPHNFIGLSVSPDQQYESAIIEMVEELGVNELLIRVPIWQLDQLDNIERFMSRFVGKRWLINILQDRESVRDPLRWQQGLRQIFQQLSPFCDYFQIGTAINRTKWGCGHSGEYLPMLEAAETLRCEFPGIRLVGSSVIDFEPLVSWRTLHNRHAYQLDVVSSLLYINRRGPAYGRQYRHFDLYNKLRLIRALVECGNRNAKRLWITETNWPLLNTKPYTPNSGHPSRTVDELTQAQYLKQYYQIAWHCGWVDKVYWWQLINPGYGLVDHRSGQLRKHPAFTALKDLLAGEINQPIAFHNNGIT